MNKRTPFEKVRKGDVIILKESGGLVTGVFVAGDVNYFRIANKKTLEVIKTNYAEGICSNADANFWKSRAKSKYVTLIEVKKVKKILPFKSEKKDRSGWSILREGILDNLFTPTK